MALRRTVWRVERGRAGMTGAVVGSRRGVAGDRCVASTCFEMREWFEEDDFRLCSTSTDVRWDSRYISGDSSVASSSSSITSNGFVGVSESLNPR